jgi:hypothetical protein
MMGGVDWFHRRVRMPVHSGYSRPVTLHRDSPLRDRLAPQPMTPAPRFEPRAPRAERPYPRRDARQDVASPELRRLETRSSTVVDPNPRFTQRTPEARQPAAAAPDAPARFERAPRPETRRIERAPRRQPAPSQPQRIEPAAPQPQPPASQPPRSQPQRLQSAQAQPPRVEHAPGAAPQRTEHAARRNERDAREAPPRWGARP